MGEKDEARSEIGICGEHGGHPDSVEFCHGIGISYVSCSTFRLPIARLAAAHAKTQGEDKKPAEGYDPDAHYRRLLLR